MSIEVKLVVDREKQKFVFAECGSDFVDVLCSFLTLPLGIIVKLLDKKSELGCMDKLYKSVEDLDANKYLQTALCKTMLLQPKSIAEDKWEELAVDICGDLDLNPRRIFCCPDWYCAYKKFPYYSLVSGVECKCGKVMNNFKYYPRFDTNDDVFFKGSVVQFLVSDNLHICLASSASVAFSFLENHGVDELTNFEEKKIKVDKTQILALLKASFLSETPLTDVFLFKQVKNATAEIAVTPSSRIKTEIDDNASTKRKRDGDHEYVVTTVKILESNNVKLVEAGSDFIDQVLSFLTFPLGQVLSLLGKSCLKLGSVRNLHNSIDNLKVDNYKEILSDEDKEMLLCAKLPPYFGCRNQLLEVDEIQPQTYSIRNCKSCFKIGLATCWHSTNSVLLTVLNPKLVKAAPENGGGFAVTSVRFIVANDLTVKPLLVSSTLQTLKDLGVSLSSLQERIVTVDKTKALKFLEACLTSNTGIIDSLLN